MVAHPRSTLVAPEAAAASGAVADLDAGTGPILLVAGASNLHLGLLPFATALDRAIGAQGLTLLAAPGAGRSYAKPAGALGVLYPGHLESDLPVAARAVRGSGRRLALLMDIGNDIGYGERPEQLLSWIAELKGLLQEAGFTIVIQRPPVASISRLPERRFDLVKRLYFPRTPLTRADLIARAQAVDDGLLLLVDGRCELVGSISPYAGPDGIHVAPWRLPVFWSALAKELVNRLDYPEERAQRALIRSRTAALAQGIMSRRLKPRRWSKGAWHERPEPGSVVWSQSPRYEVTLRHGSRIVRL